MTTMEGGNKIFNSKSKTFLAFCFCFIAGVSTVSVFDWPAYWEFRFYCVLFVIGFLVIVAWHKPAARFGLVCLLFFFLGGWRFLVSVPASDKNHLAYYNEQKIYITGTVSSEPTVGINKVDYVLSASAPARGKVFVSTLLYPRYEYGDQLEMSCYLHAPQNSPTSSFNYQKYLAKDGIYSVCYNPKILSVKPGSEWSPLRALLSFKNILQTQVEKLWPEPEASLMAGLLYGARAGLPAELKNDFSTSGLSHIVAISGYNISVVAVVLMTVLIGLGLYRRQAFWVAVAGIILFVIFCGASASVVRAGIMGIIVLIAGQLGRLSRVGNILAFTAALMLLVNPFVLVWDAGFQLSFLATMGLVYLSPILEQKFGPRLAFFPAALREILFSTFSAIIATLPLILFQFGRLSIVAPVANLLVLPTIPYLMLVGFFALIFSFIFFPLGQIMAFGAHLGLKYVIIIIHLLAALPGSALTFSITWWAMLAFYVLMLAIIYGKKNKNSSIGRGL